MANDKVITREQAKSFDKYRFETDFFEVTASPYPDDAPPQSDVSDLPEAVKPHAPLTEQDLAQAESAGYAAGLEEGKQQASEDFKKELNLHTAAFAAALAEIETLRETLSAELSQKALQLLADTLPTLLADARNKYPEALLERAAEKLTEALKVEKVLTVQTAPQTAQFLKDHLAADKRFANHLRAEQFIETPALAIGDCIIEWATGGLALSHTEILDQITGLLLGAAETTKTVEKKPIAPPSAEILEEPPLGDPSDEI